MADLNNDPVFGGWDDKTRHAYLSDTDPAYKGMAPGDQQGYLKYLRDTGTVSAPEHPWVRENRYARAGKPLPEQPTARQAAVEGAATLGTMATGPMGPLAGAAVRTGIAAAEPVLAGTGGWWDALKRGGINAAIESVLPVGGKLARSAPGVEGKLLRGIEAERASGQAAADTARTQAHGEATAAYGTAKKMAEGTSESMFGKKVADWKDEVAGIKSGYKMDAERLAREDAAKRAEPLVRTMGEKVPPAGLKSAADVHDFAWGEKSWDKMRSAMDEGQANVESHMRGRPVRLPELGEPGSATMTFSDAWKRVGEIASPSQRAKAMDALRAEVGRGDPSGQALAVFDDLRKIYSTGVTTKSIAKKAFPASGGAEFDPEGFINWFNARREPLARRLKGDYEDVANAAYGSTPRGTAYTPPRPPQPVMPTRPAQTPIDMGPAPTMPERTVVEPRATVQSMPLAARIAAVSGGAAGIPFTHGATAPLMLFPNLFSRWRGQVPLSPSTRARTIFDLFAGAAARPSNSRETPK